ncbi:MAG: GNAT family N-acetyltransferase, partial [Acidimicrobiia bacterium]
MRELRAITDDEFEPLLRILMTAFGEEASAEATAQEKVMFELDRSIAAFEDGDLVGSAAAYSFGLTVPGGATVPTAG